jgi:hypothetical protein
MLKIEMCRCRIKSRKVVIQMGEVESYLIREGFVRPPDLPANMPGEIARYLVREGLAEPPTLPANTPGEIARYLVREGLAKPPKLR